MQKLSLGPEDLLHSTKDIHVRFLEQLDFSNLNRLLVHFLLSCCRTGNLIDQSRGYQPQLVKDFLTIRLYCCSFKSLLFNVEIGCSRPHRIATPIWGCWNSAVVDQHKPSPLCRSY